MTNPEFHPMEQLADADQAQAIAVEIERITQLVPETQGLANIKNHSAPSKTRWHEGMLFIRYPEGESSVDDANSVNLSSVSWDNEDSSRTSYCVELNVDNGLQLTKHTYPATPENERTPMIRRGDSARVMLRVASSAAAMAQGQQAKRIEERSLGLHLAYRNEASELIERLQQVEPAPEERW